MKKYNVIVTDMKTFEVSVEAKSREKALLEVQFNSSKYLRHLEPIESSLFFNEKEDIGKELERNIDKIILAKDVTELKEAYRLAKIELDKLVKEKMYEICEV
ncbi:hypothetical protein [Eubacterium oxidoreducens]|uniref:Uncharacterized protein n=1 Tax=Eubacterium oxidoreducens TaxID=1732 RepID=A0A1G6B2R7_EUBOX|nr:hypothetical protein [Eubacterium oxidoreducens]SDB14981.1 hypothetical protein SAMN02910417_01098 [Eubacterium oxidoreducens]